MDEETAFLRGIAASPEDDLPRLVYADWLEERDDPRHEFLRLAVRAHSETTKPSDLPSPLNRLCELRRIVSPEWVRQVHPALAMDDVREVVFLSMFERIVRPHVFVQVQREEPSRYLLGLLRQRYPECEPGSEMHTNLGLPMGGVLFRVLKHEWVEDGRCEIEGMMDFISLGAYGYQYRVGAKGGWWAVESSEQTWIS